MIKLSPSKYFLAQSIFDSIPFNSLFALSVVNKNSEGEIYVDNEISPNAFLIISKYGIGLLYSNTPHLESSILADVIETIMSNSTIKWLMVHPEEVWKSYITDIKTKKLTSPKLAFKLDKRVNFSFKRNSFKSVENYPNEVKIMPFDYKRDSSFSGSVIPKNFWKSDKIHNCFGYSIYYNNTLASIAFSSYRYKNMFEIGIETNPKYRGKRLAYYATSKIIDYCIENNLEPIWACHYKNNGSIALANKLGFITDSYYDYYTLIRDER